MKKHVLLFISVIAVIRSGRCQTAPSISVNVLSGTHTYTDGDATCVVDNRKMIEIAVVCQSTAPSILKAFGYSAINPARTSANDLQFIVVDTSSGERLKAKTSKMGAERRVDRRSIFVSLQIPENDAIRRGKLQAAINSAERAEPMNWLGIEDINRNRELILSALDVQYVENRQGHFLFSALYYCSEPDVWNGSVSSPNVAITVKDDGTAVNALGASE
jgi:hypothetical protein